jgi:hypothetical protein
MFFYVAKIIMFNKNSTNTKDLKKLTQIWNPQKLYYILLYVLNKFKNTWILLN